MRHCDTTRSQEPNDSVFADLDLECAENRVCQAGGRACCTIASNEVFDCLGHSNAYLAFVVMLVIETRMGALVAIEGPHARDIF